MPWERRQTGRYYYKAVRIGGQPRHMYLGTGPGARMHEILDRGQRRRRQAAQVERAVIAEDNRVWRELWGLLRSLVSASMLISGYYNHRGEWRKVMGDPRTRQDRVHPEFSPQTREVLADLEALNARANAGEPGSRAQLQILIRDHPELWQTMGDLNRMITQKAVKRICKDTAMREMISLNLQEWRDELIGPDDTPIIRALADTAVSAKLALVAAEMQTQTDVPSLAGTALKSRCLDRAQHRLSATLKKLHEVKRANAGRVAPAKPSPPSQSQMAQAG